MLYFVNEELGHLIFKISHVKVLHSKVNCEGNTSNGVNENISKVLEVYDEETCLETMKGGKYELKLIQSL